ncbi:hydrolase -related [Anaeramoeba flamelloides]|uniref:Hydrolase -related n=1 Tax=Anaeramoeba flamelloides TaxID=1746091 RepID=A0AAV8ABF2_9EUKA|nr:hydrolase -related [Anaeramoeba flamelloides]
MTKLIATLIGSGTSYGVPVPGCFCEVCCSKSKKDKRLRSSLLIQKINENNKEENVNIIIDAGPDFRRQALKYNIDHINGIAVTHTHSDHIAGFDDVYSFAIRNKQIPVYSSLDCYGGMVERFGYIWEKEKRSEYLPWHEIKGNKQFEIEGIPITPIDVVHSVAQTHAFRIGDFVYMP